MLEVNEPPHSERRKKVEEEIKSAYEKLAADTSTEDLQKKEVEEMKNFFHESSVNDIALERMTAILKHLHSDFFLRSVGPVTLKSGIDIKQVMFEYRKKVLAETHICFSGVFPTSKIESKEHKNTGIWRLASAFGARCYDDPSKCSELTHLVATKETPKVTEALESNKYHVVHIEWLMAVFRRWTREKESLYPISILNLRPFPSPEEYEKTVMGFYNIDVAGMEDQLDDVEGEEEEEQEDDDEEEEEDEKEEHLNTSTITITTTTTTTTTTSSNGIHNNELPNGALQVNHYKNETTNYNQTQTLTNTHQSNLRKRNLSDPTDHSDDSQQLNSTPESSSPPKKVKFSDSGVPPDLNGDGGHSTSTSDSGSSSSSDSSAEDEDDLDFRNLIEGSFQ
eukprot:TRINITY_DN5082_c0_g1_i2.p1 TRINITY_DN5082_c0_g1~~TRINITY_DN5082_c0_g1_i2.p1  ORF type:complete len:394 (-),score=75.35 TRINITY_DN5082_c0_g1_i2:12-1193(-)